VFIHQGFFANCSFWWFAKVFYRQRFRTLTLAASYNNHKFTATDSDVDDNYAEVEPECIEEFLERQQQDWENATNCTEDTEGCLDPAQPIDVCDIRAIASWSASKGKNYWVNNTYA